MPISDFRILLLLFAFSASAAETALNIEKALTTDGTGITLEAESLDFGSGHSPTSIVADVTASGRKWVRLESAKAGEYIEFSTPSLLPPGYYSLALAYRPQPRFGTAVITVDDKVLGRFIDQAAGTNSPPVAQAPVGEFFHSSNSPVRIRLTLLGSRQGNAPFLGADCFHITPAVIRNEAAGTAARNENLRVDAIAQVRRLQDPPLTAGTAHSPFYALPAYDPAGGTIPANAIDRKDYATIGDWFSAMSAKQLPGKIGSGTYLVGPGDLDSQALTTSIYGYDSGAGMPVFDGKNRPGLFYLRGSGITLVNCGGDGALLFREANATTAAFRWRGTFKSNSTTRFDGTNYILDCDLK